MNETCVSGAAEISRISAEIGLDLETTIGLLNMLFPQTRQTNCKLKQAAENGSHKDVATLAHDIKGSCGNFRLMDIYEVSAAIEKMGKNGGDAGEILRLCVQIDRMIDRYAEEVGKLNGSTQGTAD